jgi:GGDEF domain-containing protein
MLKAFLWSILIPLGLCLTALALQPWVKSLPDAMQVTAHYLPYGLMAITMVLSLSFNQTRLFLALLLTGLFLILLQEDLSMPAGLSGTSDQMMLGLMALFYPVVLAWLLLIKERGLWNLVGILRLVFILSLPPLVLWFAQGEPPLPMSWLNSRLLPVPRSHLSSLPDLVLLINALVLTGMVLGLFIRPSVMASGFMGLLLGTGLGFHFYPAVASLQWMVTAGLIVVLVNIIRGSFHMAYRDELTGLPARRALKEQLLKLGRRYSIAMLDVDHFKKFNDRYGHDVGDQVLQMVGTHLARAGGGSKAFRYGGEEFTLVFAGKEAEAVVPCLERFRQEIADTAFIVRDKGRPRKKPGKPIKAAKKKSRKEKKRVQITISIGVSDSSGPEKSPAEVIKAADKALYRAKRKGRNRVAK